MPLARFPNVERESPTQPAGTPHQLIGTVRHGGARGGEGVAAAEAWVEGQPRWVKTLTYHSRLGRERLEITTLALPYL